MKRKKEKTPELKAPEKRKKRGAFKRTGNLLTFLIVVGFGGFVFYRGWIQFSIPENHYALVFTKTGGYDSTLLKAGDFNWRWENLFPTNMTLHIFELPWTVSDFTVSGSLPSGNEYASILPEKGSFDYTMDLTMQFRLNPDRISDFIKDESFLLSDIDSWYQQLPGEAVSISRKALTEVINRNEMISDISLIENDIREELEQSFPAVEITFLTIPRWSFPDQTLYEQTRLIYLEGIKASSAYTAALEKQNVLLEKQLKSKMELLNDYGKILTEFPILLQYFNLEKDKIDPMIFNWEESFPIAPES